MDKKKAKIIINNLLIFFLQVIFSKINLFGFLSPFGLSFAFVRLYFGANIIVVSIEYLISKIPFLFSIQGLLVTIYQIVIISLYYFAKEFLKTIKPIVLLFVMAILSSALELYFNSSSLINIFEYIISLAFLVIFILFFCKFFKEYKSKIIFSKLSRIDYIIFAIFCLLLSLGIFSYTYNVKFLELFILSLILLVMSRVFPPDKYFIFSSIMALGLVIVSSDYFYLLYAVITSILLAGFKEFNRWVFGLIALLINTVLVLFFRLFDAYIIVSLALSIILSVVIPEKFIQSLQMLFEFDAFEMIYRQIDSQKISEIKNKLILMSNTLFSMQKNFKLLMVGKINHESASVELSGDVILKCCSDCENYKYCYFGNINKKAMFDGLMFKAITNGSVNENDLTNGMQAYCSKNNIVISEINQTAKLFLSYESAMKTQDESKLIISSELQNFGEIFLNFSKIIDRNIKPDKKLSKILKDKLIGLYIDAKEVLILENSSGIVSVSVIAPNEELLKKELINSISKITKIKFNLKSIEHTAYSGLSLAVFEPITKLKINFFVSNKAKEKRSGDNVLMTKLSDSRYFVAIADGMGHGEKANKISNMVLSLIKSMFEVGLDDELIIQSVNKLLIPAGLDNFTTLDACVVDLESEMCTFIKLGSSVSVIKHKATSELAVCESLPIGIVQNIKPTIIKKNIQAGDIIFLASDGVVDSFPTVENYKCFINDAKIYDTQKFLDDVIFDAENMGKHPDDMTIVAINLLKNY